MDNTSTTPQNDASNVTTVTAPLYNSDLVYRTSDDHVSGIKLSALEFVSLENSEDVVIYGTNEQVMKMFTDWANYIGEIQNPNNTAVNPFFKKADGSGSLYAPLDEVLSNARPILSKHGFGIFQVPNFKTGLVSVKTILTHKSGAFINFPQLSVPISKNDAQGVVSGITYARRGSLNPIIGVHGENEDDDGNSASGSNTKKGTTKLDSKDDAELRQTISSINALATELGGSKNEEVMGIIKPFVASGNTNLIKEIAVAKELYTTLTKFRESKKANK